MRASFFDRRAFWLARAVSAAIRVPWRGSKDLPVRAVRLQAPAPKSARGRRSAGAIPHRSPAAPVPSGRHLHKFIRGIVGASGEIGPVLVLVPGQLVGHGDDIDRPAPPAIGQVLWRQPSIAAAGIHPVMQAAGIERRLVLFAQFGNVQHALFPSIYAQQLLGMMKNSSQPVRGPCPPHESAGRSSQHTYARKCSGTLPTSGFSPLMPRGHSTPSGIIGNPPSHDRGGSSRTGTCGAGTR